MSSFRFAGLPKPTTKPKVRIVRTPVWESNKFSGPNPDNDPIYSVQGDPAFGPTAATLQSPSVTNEVFHYRLPGTAYLTQAADTTMSWGIDKCFAFKCYVRMDSVTGRIPIWSRRSSIDSGGPFVEIRDGHVVCGWYDIKLKKEVYVKTSKPVIDPGYVYYIYYRKWFPRGGHNLTGNGSLFYGGGNWLNSVHYGSIATGGSANIEAAYDALIVRRFPRVKPTTTDYNSWCGYDAKPHRKAGGSYSDWYTVKSSTRASVSFVAADSNYGTSPSAPYEPASSETRMGPSGCVMYKVPVSTSSTGDTLVISYTSPTVPATQRFLLDHEGMLLQIEDTTAGAPHKSEAFRIVEVLSPISVRLLKADGTSPTFSFATGAAWCSVFPDVSLVKSQDYDASVSPDTADYAIEAFGSSLAGDPLSGISQFNGRAWSFSWGMFQTTHVDGASYKVSKPDIFENGGAAIAATQKRISCGSEIGTDWFGLQGSTNPEDGRLIADGVPAGELEVDNTYARVAVDTMQYRAGTFPWTTSAVMSTIPSSTQPNATGSIALDASSTSATALTVQLTREVPPGDRRMRISYYDPETDEEGAPGDEISFSIQDEDSPNPSGRTDIVLDNLPISSERGRTVWRRVRLSLDGSSTYFIAKDIEDSSSYSSTVAIDDVSMQAFSDPVTSATLLSSYGAPPKASYLLVSSGRLIAGKLDYSGNSIAYSKSGQYGSFPVANILPVAAGDSQITGLAAMQDAFVVFKRGAIVAYRFNDATIIMQRMTFGDGCTSNASIVPLEDRVYYMSDRGPMVLMPDYTPFFVGWRIQNLMPTFDQSSLSSTASGVNRARGQIVMTARKNGETRTNARIGLEFQHPMKGEDTMRAELIAGHRFSYYEEPAATSFATLQRQTDSQARLVAGTEDGFAVWMDRSDTQLSMVGSKLEGTTGAIGTGALASRWSTKDMDLDMIEMDKLVHYLDASRPHGLTGTLTVEVYRNRATSPIGTFSLDLSQPFSSEELGLHLQEARSFRLLFKLPASHSGTIWELLDLTLRHQIVDSK